MMRVFPRILVSRKIKNPIHHQAGAVVASLSLIVSGLTLTALVGSQASGSPLNGSRTASGTAQPFAANPFTAPVGGSWVDVPIEQRLYFEDFDRSEDDDVFFSVPAGITCTENGVEANGPFLATIRLDGTNKCKDNRVDPAVDFDPISNDPLDASNSIAGDVRRGAIPIGFEINFFGQTYDSLYPNENGGVSFARPSYNYNYNLAGATDQAKTSAIYPLGLDLYYLTGVSNFWVANTTVDTKPALVMSWENIHECCDNDLTAVKAAFQLVILDLGGGDFDAYFNYGKFEILNQGYNAPKVTINMQTVGQEATNVFRVDNLTGFDPNSTCHPMSRSFFGLADRNSFTDTAFATAVNSNGFMKVENLQERTVSLWAENTCTTPINTTQGVTQDVSADGHVYLQLTKSNDTYSSSAIGWGTYNNTTGEISATELRQNVANATQIDAATIDGSPSPNRLIVSSYRTEVPGRFVIGQRGGATIGDPNPDNAVQETAVSTPPSAPSRDLSAKPSVPPTVMPGSSAVLLNEGGEAHTVSTDVDKGSMTIEGQGWAVALSAARPAGKSASVSAPNGDIRIPLSGTLSFKMSGYEPAGQVMVYALPSGRLVASLTVNKNGVVDYKGVKLPRNLSLSNKHLQFNGLSEAGLVRSITINAKMFKRVPITTQRQEIFDRDARASIRKILADATGERVVRCVAYADMSSEEDVAAKTLKAQQFCDYVTKQDPTLVTKVVVREPFKKRMNNRVALRLRG